MSSMFRFDLRQETLMHPHLDGCYRSNGIVPTRHHDLQTQKLGIDLTITNGRVSFLVDEKCQMHYIGQRLPTFALELSYLVDGVHREGWLFDQSKRTEVYAFVFDVELANGTRVLKDSSQVTNSSVVLVNRQRLIRSLASAGLDKSMLESIESELRRTQSLTRSVRTPGVRIVRSAQLPEQPVNLLVRRSFLESIGQVLHR